jgi:PAS domain S-box-containing protein
VGLADGEGVVWNHLPIMIASTPIRNEKGKIAGVLAFKMRPGYEFASMFKVSQSGRTEETIAFSSEGTMLSESLFIEDLRRVGLVPNGPKSLSILNVHLRDPGGNLLEGHRPTLSRKQQPLTRMAERAVKKTSGIDLEGYRDYRGVSVVGAWTWLDDYDFGVGTKIDVKEALGPLKTMNKTYILQFYLVISAGLLGLCLRIRQVRIEEERNDAERRVETGEVRMRAIMDNVSDGIITIDGEGNIETFNSGAETMFGYPFAEVQGKDLIMLMPESYRNQHSDSLKRYLESGKARILGINIEVQGQRKDGSVFPIELSVNEMCLNGEGKRFTGIIRDITERKKSEEALRKAYGDLQLRSDDLTEANDKLVRSNQELDDFAYIASHDLKEPLRGIHNYATFLLEDYADKIDEDGKAKLNTLIRLTQRLESFINSLLYFSRVGRIDLAYAET